MENTKTEITEKKWNDINDEISEILEIFWKTFHMI